MTAQLCNSDSSMGTTEGTILPAALSPRSDIPEFGLDDNPPATVINSCASSCTQRDKFGEGFRGARGINLLRLMSRESRYNRGILASLISSSFRLNEPELG